MLWKELNKSYVNSCIFFNQPLLVKIYMNHWKNKVPTETVRFTVVQPGNVERQ